jgi:hypothetical protein
MWNEFGGQFGVYFRESKMYLTSGRFLCFYEIIYVVPEYPANEDGGSAAPGLPFERGTDQEGAKRYASTP